MLRTWLEQLAPHIHLVAIMPDAGASSPPAGGWFGSDVGAAEAWARGWNAAGAGVYWSVNIVRDGLHKKPTKADVVGIRFAHCDVDDTRDVGRLVALNPSAIIDSGNGLQPVWRLVEPTDAAGIEAINRGLVAALGGDAACWNVDRLLRLPGLVNHPSAVKRARGKVAAPTGLPLLEPARTYRPADLAATWPAPTRKTRETEVELGEWEPTRLEDMTPPLPVEVMALCSRERAPGERSEHVSACVVALARAGCSREEIMGLLMHPENAGLHGHIADQADPERQARRKVALAAGHSPGEALARSERAAAPAGMLPEPRHVTAAAERGMELRENTGPMLASEQMEYFEGCVYVLQHDAIWDPRRGMLMSRGQFNTSRGGRAFTLDDTGAKTTREAWTAYTNNDRYKPIIVHNTCFRPEVPAQAIVNEDGFDRVNIYQPVDTPRQEGDAGPFVDLVGRMLPNGQDAEILLSYMASLVRNPGSKFMWAPVIQGTQGNGKTTLLDVLENCVGLRYCHRPLVAKLVRGGVNFNEWMGRTLLAGMEEIYAPTRRQFLEEFKPFLTNGRVAIEAKGVDDVTADNRCNYFFLTNHKEAVTVDSTDRRYAVLYCAQQDAADLLRDGMDSAYFRRLWAWLRADGFAICNHYLRTRPIADELDPARGATRAPRTSSTAEAIEVSRGALEQELQEAIEQGLPGFCGGWVSSLAAIKCARASGHQVSPQVITKVLRSLGYIPHPALGPRGQVNNVVMPDGRRPRLFVKRDSIAALNAPTAADAERLYEASNAGLADNVRAG